MDGYELLEVIKKNKSLLEERERELLNKQNNLLNIKHVKDYDTLINSLSKDFDVLAHTERIKEIVKSSLVKKTNRISLNFRLNSLAFFLLMGVMNIVNPMGDFAVIFTVLGVLLLAGEALISNHLLYRKEYRNMQEVLASKDIDEVARDLEKARNEKQKLDASIKSNEENLAKTKDNIIMLEGTYNMVLKILEEIPHEELTKESLKGEQARKRMLHN